ncbi:MAG: hypothetical protein CXB60_08245 [Spiroplasma poulsonii]|nr:hypothetical protein [Spiroplasma poulsonii]
MYTFTKNEYGRNIGDVYFGTTNGVYLRKSGELTTNKIDNIDNSIALIQYHGNGSVHIIDGQGKIYWVSPNGNARADNDVPYPVTTMYTFTKNEYGRSTGDTYFGTTNGVYLRKNNELGTTKINGIDKPIALIQYHGNGSVHIIDGQGKIYWVSPNGNARAYNDVPYPVTTMYTFTKNEYGRSTGDTYFGTTNGVYLRKNNELGTTKINGIDKPIALIQYHGNGSVHIIDGQGKIYWVSPNGNARADNDVPYPVTTMYTFTKNEYGRSTGDTYFGTTNGVYLRKNNELGTTKINGIDGIIIYIKPYTDNNNSVHIINLILNKNILERRQDNQNNNINLNVPVIRQTEDYWCAPAVGEAILRFFGRDAIIDPQTTNSHEDYDEFQRVLSILMNTVTNPRRNEEGGTLSQDFASALNGQIDRYFLNNQRHYSITELGDFDDTTNRLFYDRVLYSLQNNSPVAFLYHGSNNVNEHDHSHFIVIIGIRNNYNNVIYRYMNPATGTFGEFNSSNLVTYLTPGFNTMFANQVYGGTLVSYTGVSENNCIIPEASLTNIFQAAAATAVGSFAGGSVFPIIGNIIGGAVAFYSWNYLKWLKNCS